MDVVSGRCCVSLCRNFGRPGAVHQFSSVIDFIAAAAGGEKGWAASADPWRRARKWASSHHSAVRLIATSPRTYRRQVERCYNLFAARPTAPCFVSGCSRSRRRGAASAQSSPGCLPARPKAASPHKEPAGGGAECPRRLLGQAQPPTKDRAGGSVISSLVQLPGLSQKLIEPAQFADRVHHTGTLNIRSGPAGIGGLKILSRGWPAEPAGHSLAALDARDPVFGHLRLGAGLLRLSVGFGRNWRGSWRCLA